MKDLAFYVTLCSLMSMNRQEIKNQILAAPGFKTLMESADDGSSEDNVAVSDIIENFLNGKYKEYQR